MHPTLPPRLLAVDLALALGLVLLGSLTWVLVHEPGPGYGVAAVAIPLLVLALAVRSVWRRDFGPADRITLLRLSMTAVCAGWVLLSVVGMAPVRAWWLLGVAALAAALDAVDGPVARRTGTASARGARFDVEADAALLLVLSLQASLVVGPWALVVGALRYLFVAAGWRWPALRAPLTPHRSRRRVAAVQPVALLLALTPLTPVPVAATVMAAAAGALCWSFGRDTVELLARRG